jgi:hypothetical protein
MFSFRSMPESARSAFATIAALAACALLMALPASADAAPEGGEPGPTPPVVPQLAFEPGSYDFGLQEANRNTSQTTLQLRNVGAAAAPVYSLEISGPGSGAYWIGNSDCYGRTLEAGETCSVQVNFNPYDAVPFSAQLRVGSAEGATAVANLSGEGGRSQIVPAVDPTNFGSTPVGGPAVTRTIDLVNKGNMAGGLFIAVVAGGAISSFHLIDENCTGTPLSPAATCNLEVSFQPSSPGAKTARIGLFGDGEGGTMVNLSGVGLDPESAADAKPQAGALTTSPGSHRRRGGRRRIHRGGMARGRRAAIADLRKIG